MNIAIVGATGMVGRKILEVLTEKCLLAKEFYFYASEKSAGKTIEFQGKKYEILSLCEENIIGKKIDFALFSAGAEMSRIYAPVFVRIGARVIDNSSEWRMHENVPLIVPEVNFNCIKPYHSIVANPNCSTIQAVAVLAPLHQKFKIKRIVFSTYQAVSGAGKQGMDDLALGEKGILPKKFPHPIYNNILPHIDAFKEDGYTKEEHKMINETRKILGDEKLKITATTVRVPIMNCHSESINIEFKKPCTLPEIRQTLAEAEGVKLLDNSTENLYPMAINADGRDEVFVGRIRLDHSVKSGVNLWVVADNLRKGAATNAVQILEKLMQEYIKVDGKSYEKF